MSDKVMDAVDAAYYTANPFLREAMLWDVVDRIREADIEFYRGNPRRYRV